jgi:hypothetical protein
MTTTQNSPQERKSPPLRLLAWEVTRRCNLSCLHCRAAAGSGPYPGELTTAEGKKLLDDLATMGQVVVILTGGEPLLRDDIFDLAAYGAGLGHRRVPRPPPGGSRRLCRGPGRHRRLSRGRAPLPDQHHRHPGQPV